MDNRRSGWHWQAGDYWSTRVTGLQVIDNPSAKPGHPIGFAPKHPAVSQQRRQSVFPPQVMARQRI